MKPYREGKYSNSLMTSAELRRINKPIVEKKRRERINGCLEELKHILLESAGKEESSQSKLEKADILEMAVKYLRSMHRASPSAGLQKEFDLSDNQRNKETGVMEEGKQYLNGYNDCAREITTYLSHCTELSASERSRVLNQLTSRIQSMHSMTSVSVLNSDPSRSLNSHSSITSSQGQGLAKTASRDCTGGYTNAHDNILGVSNQVNTSTGAQRVGDVSHYQWSSMQNEGRNPERGFSYESGLLDNTRTNVDCSRKRKFAENSDNSNYFASSAFKKAKTSVSSSETSFNFSASEQNIQTTSTVVSSDVYYDRKTLSENKCTSNFTKRFKDYNSAFSNYDSCNFYKLNERSIYKTTPNQYDRKSEHNDYRPTRRYCAPSAEYNENYRIESPVHVSSTISSETFAKDFSRVPNPGKLDSSISGMPDSSTTFLEESGEQDSGLVIETSHDEITIEISHEEISFDNNRTLPQLTYVEKNLNKLPNSFLKSDLNCNTLNKTQKSVTSSCYKSTEQQNSMTSSIYVNNCVLDESMWRPW